MLLRQLFFSRMTMKVIWITIIMGASMLITAGVAHKCGRLSFLFKKIKSSVVMSPKTLPVHRPTQAASRAAWWKMFTAKAKRALTVPFVFFTESLLCKKRVQAQVNNQPDKWLINKPLCAEDITKQKDDFEQYVRSKAGQCPSNSWACSLAQKRYPLAIFCRPLQNTIHAVDTGVVSVSDELNRPEAIQAINSFIDEYNARVTLESHMSEEKSAEILKSLAEKRIENSTLQDNITMGFAAYWINKTNDNRMQS